MPRPTTPTQLHRAATPRSTTDPHLTQAPPRGPEPPTGTVRPTRRPLVAPALLVGAGVAIALGTSNHAVAVAAWVAPVLLVRFLRTTPTARGLAIAAAVHAIAFSWAWQAQWPVPPLLLAGLATIFFLPYVADRLLQHRLGPVTGTLVLPTAWVTVEHLLVRLPLLEGSPIGSWAAAIHSQVDGTALLQSVAVTGPWGITFLIGWTAAAVNLAWARGGGDASARAVLGVVLTVLVAVTTLGGLRVALAGTPASTVRAAGIVVENDDILVRTWSPVRRGTPITAGDRAELRDELSALHDRLFELSDTEVEAGARIVVWAEDNALVFREEADALVARGRAFARDRGIALLMGMVVLEAGQPADNQVVGITPDGEVAFTYLKSYPAPGEGSRPGDGQLAWMDTPWGRVGVAICFDHDFPALIRQAGRAGVDILVNPSDDTPAIDPLHARMAVPRAIENGVSMLRPAKGARSMAVDAYGRVLAVQEAVGPERHLAVDLPNQRRRTLYPVIGDAVAHASGAGLLLLATLALVRSRRRPSRVTAR